MALERVTDSSANYLDLLHGGEHAETDSDPELIRQAAKEMEDLAENAIVPENIRGKISSITATIPLFDHRNSPSGKLTQRTWHIRIHYKDGQRTGMDMFVGGHNPFYRISSESNPPEIYWTENFLNHFNELVNYSRTNNLLTAERAKTKIVALLNSITNSQE